MRRAAAAVIVVAALAAAINFLTSAQAATVTLDSGANSVLCPPSHRAYAAYMLNREGLNIECRPLAAPTPTNTPQPTSSPTRTNTPVPATATPTPPSGAHPNCQNRVPLGGIEPQRPEWCFLPQNPEVTTHVNGANSWLDDWQHGQSHGRLGNGTDGYRAGVLGDRCQSIHFRHNQHWMSDTLSESAQYPTLCATWLRPDRSFTGQTLVVETEVAVPIAGTREVDGLSDSWPEVVITNAPAPTRLRANGTYLYETFPGAWTFGCRLQQNRQPLCALYNTGQSFAGSSDRVWEINQTGGQVRFQSGGGAYSSPAHAAAWKQCTSTDDPDTVCRNVFRFEFFKDTSNQYVFRLFVNNFLYYEAGLLPGMESLFAQPFYVYHGSFAYRIGGDFSVPIVRFHWRHLAINPEALQ